MMTMRFQSPRMRATLPIASWRTISATSPSDTPCASLFYNAITISPLVIRFLSSSCIPFIGSPTALQSSHILIDSALTEHLQQISLCL